MRVVSVLPSATEIVFALGHGAELVARSAECDYPPEVKRLPVAMRPRTLDSERPSRAIDQRVREARARNESLYDLDSDLLRTVRPDLLLTQSLCGVCSVTEQEVEAACALAGVCPEVVSLAPTNLAEVWASFATVARALRDPDAGQTLVETMLSRARAGPPTGRTAAVIEWLDPPILAGLWTPDIIIAAGGVPVGPRSGQPGSRTSWAELAREPPDVVLVSPCSFSVERTFRELEENAEVRACLGEVRAPLGTYVADEAYFSRPGPRLTEGVALVRALLEGRDASGAMPVRPFRHRVMA
jgi:iron complex transport system substrate-binding protein